MDIFEWGIKKPCLIIFSDGGNEVSSRGENARD